jgi:Ohr subfamily peroxiredoxin
VLAVAQHKELDAAESSVTARVGLGPTGEGPAFGITAALSVDLPRLDQETAERLVQSAHKVCPYSNAMRDNVEVEFEVRSGSEAAAPA